jgi:hypothetical protein
MGSNDWHGACFCCSARSEPRIAIQHAQDHSIEQLPTPSRTWEVRQHGDDKRWLGAFPKVFSRLAAPQAANAVARAGMPASSPHRHSPSRRNSPHDGEWDPPEAFRQDCPRAAPPHISQRGRAARKHSWCLGRRWLGLFWHLPLSTPVWSCAWLPLLEPKVRQRTHARSTLSRNRRQRILI